MGRVFISYARENKNSASEICKRLRELGLDPWIDADGLDANDDISTAIDGQLSEVDAVLVLWSAAAKSSVWVRGEALSGLSAGKYIGALLEPIAPPVPFNARNAPDLSDWNLLHNHHGWRKLIAGLARLCKPNGDTIVAALDAALRAESDHVAAEAQAQLPLAQQENQDDVPPELEEEHNYSDVDALIAQASEFLGGATRRDLTAAIVQVAFDQEILRDASFVVSDAPQSIMKPAGATYVVCASVQEAVDRAEDNAIIVLAPGTYATNARIRKNLRIVGIGWAEDRPRLFAATNAPVLTLDASVRVENVAIESRQERSAVLLQGGQSVLLRCEVSKFSDAPGRGECAVHVAGRANPIVMATSVTSKGCDGMNFVVGSGGKLIATTVISSRGVAINCRGRPLFRGCEIEAIGGHAVEVRARGYPSFEECQLSGRGAAVVKVVDARPRIIDSRVHAIRQLAFDFEGDVSGRVERSIIDRENEPEAGTSESRKGGAFGFWKPAAKERDDERVKAARQAHRIISVRSRRPPVFVANKTADGNDLHLPPMF